LTTVDYFDRLLRLIKNLGRHMNPRYRIRGTMHDARVDLVKLRNINLRKVSLMNLILRINTRTNLIYLRSEVARDRGG
jgi:hypothetical protein